MLILHVKLAAQGVSQKQKQNDKSHFLQSTKFKKSIDVVTSHVK